MEIGYVTQSLSSEDGWGRYSKSVVESISKHSNECTVLTAENAKNDIEEGNIKIYKILPGNISFRISLQLSVFYYCIKHLREVDVIHSLITPLSPGAALAAFIMRKRFVITLHGTYAVPPKGYKLKKIIKRWMMALTFKQADITTTGSPYTKQKIKEVVDLDKCKFIPNGVNSSKFNKKSSLEDKNFIMTVGAVKPRKGADIVVRSIAELKEKFPDLKYKIVGSLSNKNYVDKIKSLTRELEVEKKVEFLGRVSDEKLVKLYNECSVFVLAAREIKGAFEGFPMVFYEAMGCGTPVISTKGFGSEYAITDGHNGYVVNQEDYEKIAEKIEKILSNKKVKSKLKEGAITEAEEHTTEKISLKILDLYKK